MTDHGSSPDPALRQRVLDWIADDPDAACRAELEAHLRDSDWTALRERFGAELAFGTAGLRGEMGAGPARMNRAGVARVTAGLCAELVASVAGAQTRGLCIGFDARHMSREFAEETAAVAAGAGFTVALFEHEVPTPLLAFAVLQQGAAAGVMITASHNPARDNGYKVYWAHGAQIVSPIDTAIAGHMRALTSVRSLPRIPRERRIERGLQRSLGPELERAYLRGVAAQHPAAPVAGASALGIAYSALHGVGERTARAALEQAGFALQSVAEQAVPDPDFPTVAFPNPEEPGAMDRVCALAERTHADLAIANDPDADRLAVAARDATGTLRMLGGNEVGILLAESRLRSDRSDGPRFVLSSIVSTPMIAAVARAHGAHWEPTLTGFKWICGRALELEQSGRGRFVFGFEEALGYCIGGLVRDKDGISSAVAIARLAAELREQGLTLHDLLASLYRAHGVYVSGQISLRAQGADATNRFATWMRQARDRPPTALAGLMVEARTDLAREEAFGDPAAPLRLPPTNALLWQLAGGHRVMLRPSGTEPKLKLYIDVCEPVDRDEPVDAARSRANATLAGLRGALRTWLDKDGDGS